MSRLDGLVLLADVLGVAALGLGSGSRAPLADGDPLAEWPELHKHQRAPFSGGWRIPTCHPW
jgi:hypothetical protein